MASEPMQMKAEPGPAGWCYKENVIIRHLQYAKWYLKP